MSYDWRANQPFNPVWTDMESLLRVLKDYKSWYDEGCSDAEVSRRIARKYTREAAPRFSGKSKGPRYDALSDVVRNRGR